MGQWRWRRAALLIIVMGAPWGCVPDSPGESDGVALPAPEPVPVGPVEVEEFRPYLDDQARLRLPVPRSAYRVTSRHFDPAGPSHQIRHQLTLSLGDETGDRSPAVRVDVWDDPRGRPVRLWADQTVPFLLDDSRAATTRRVTAWDREGLVLEHPGSPQVHPRITALVAAGGRVFRITCLRAQDDRARAAFEHIVAELEPEVAP